MKLFRIENFPTYIRIYFRGKRIFSHHKRISVSFVEDNYARTIKHLRDRLGKQVIRVGFLVNELAKWQYQSLYEELEQSPWFEPVVLVTKMDKELAHYKSLQECYAFFAGLGLRTELAYNSERGFLPLSDFDIDILFYQQPWFVHSSQSPISVSQYALTCYMGYGILLVKYPDMYTHRFHKYLWTMFVSSSMFIREFEQLMGKAVTNCKEVSYVKLDNYLLPAPPTVHIKKVIIYAPHHSFEDNSLRCALFQHTGRAVLEMAKSLREDIHWIFKPHPRFRHAVIKNKILTEEEVNDYYNDWSQLGEIYEGGDYIDKFRQSFALITDCVSFLGEYLPSGNPVFHLVNNPSIFNELGQEIISAYYQVDAASLEKVFRQVVIEGDDFLREKRLAKIPLLFRGDERASSKILHFLEEAICESV